MLEKITAMVINLFDFVFSPITLLKPHVSLLIISTILTLIAFFLNRVFVDRNFLKEIKNKMDEIRANLINAQKNGNSEEMNRFLGEMMKLNREYIRHTLKATIISILILAIFLPWMKYKFSGMVVATPFNIPIIGSTLSWLYWYMLIAIAISWFFNKLLSD
ncbi:MAG: EMC3/TMCO1 family protein [Candidatus Aenigmatarchaeota archaeon]